MNETRLWLAVILLAVVTYCNPAPATERDPKQRQQFHSQHACPSTGKYKGACPGFEVDHKVPLAAGGADRPGNMQWLSKSQHKAKTARERRNCVYACKRHHKRNPYRIM